MKYLLHLLLNEIVFVSLMRDIRNNLKVLFVIIDETESIEREIVEKT